MSALALVPPPPSPTPPVALEQSLAKTLAEAGLAHMASAGLSADIPGGTSNQIVDFNALTTIAAFLATSGYKPRADWQAAFEAALVAAAREPGGSSSEFAVSAARGLGAMSAWGRRLPSEAAAPMLDATRRSLAAAPASALGPLLLGLLEVGAKPDGAWMCDWEAVTREVLEATSAWRATQLTDGSGCEEERAQRTCTAADVAALAAAAARSGNAAPGGSWTARLAAAAASLLQDFSDAGLASLASGIHGLRHKPDAPLAAAFQAELERRRGAVGSSAEIEAAAAWFAALRV